MALDAYYYPSWDDTCNSMLGAMDSFLLPPATAAAAATAAASMFPSTTDHDLPYSAEEDQQLLLHLQGFLSDFDLIPPPSCALPDSNMANIYPDSSYLYQGFPLVDHSSAAATAASVALPADSSYLYHNYHPQHPPFLLDYDDHCSSFFPRHELGDQLASYDYVMPEPPPKRQKRFHLPFPSYSFDNYSHLLTPPAPPMTAFPPPPPQKFCVCTPQVVSGEGDKGRMEGMPRAEATPQSIAARDRRKKISKKTLELGKLVPGAESGKMNTAEMLQHAFKYVKFMQSQLSLLQLIPQEQIKTESLQIVASSAVQEKLYMKDKCLVPIDLLEQLAADGDLQSQGLISTDLKQLMHSNSAQSNC